MFLDIRFPIDISFDATGGPGYSTTLATTSSGRESRNQNWEYELAAFDVAHAARTETRWRQLQAFFRIAAGRANSFRFRDWSDYICASGDGAFIASDGSPSGRQMVKVYTFGGQTVYRKVTKPVSGKITTDAVGLDYSTGIATSGNTWYGEFDLHVRFDTDVMQLDILSKQHDGSLLAGWRSIPLVEVRDE